MDPMQNLNNAAAALNEVAQRAGAFWDDADAHMADLEARFAALQQNFTDVSCANWSGPALRHGDAA